MGWRGYAVGWYGMAMGWNGVAVGRNGVAVGRNGSHYIRRSLVSWTLVLRGQGARLYDYAPPMVRLHGIHSNWATL